MGSLRVIIAGGGFGGIKLARSLSGVSGISMTLLSDQLDFRYGPALYRTATGHRGKESSLPINTLIKPIANLKFVQAKVVSIDREERVIKTADGQRFSYDYAVLALGVITSYFDIKGLEKYAYGIKSAKQIDRLRAHLHQALMDEQALDKHYVVVGGGATGVELSAALRYYLSRMAKRHHIKPNNVRIELIEAAERLLPAMRPKASRLAAKRLRKLGVHVQTRTRVESETATSLIANGKSLPTSTVIWTAGVTNNPFFTANAESFTLNEHNKVVVDESLRVDEHTFVIGDNAATPYSGLAQTAIHNASYVAHYIKQARLGKDSQPYRPFKPVAAIPVGPFWAIIQRGNLVFGGFFGSIVRLLADLIGYIDIMGVKRAVRLWIKRYEYEDRCPVCKALTLEDLLNS